MIDIHSHLLPGVDDGAQDMETAIDMLAAAEASGVSAIVATPHFHPARGFENLAGDRLERLYRRLEEERRRAGIRIRLLRGMEILATPELPELLLSASVWTINGGPCFLVEFLFDEEPDFCRRILSDCAALGFRPVIAHPERYEFVQDDPSVAYEWCVSGYGLQLNKGSLLGRFGRAAERTARKLMDHNLAACAASDAHGVNSRSTWMRELSEYLDEEYGEAYRRLLLEENPARILDGRPLLGYEPIPFFGDDR